MTRWEYLRVSYQAAPIGGVKWWIQRPGKGEDSLPESTDWFVLANELGADGWELVTDQISGSAVIATLGWDHASQPVWRSWIFKRTRE